jgi:hypothetical protein
MTWPQWVLIAYFLLVTLPVTWYMVDRPRKAYGPGVAFASTIMIAVMVWLVVIS